MANWPNTSFSQQARTLRLKDIYKAGEDAAYATFKRLQWPETDGEPVCPHCGGLEPYSITTRRRFWNQSDQRRAVVVMRKRLGRTLAFVTKREAEGVALARHHACRFRMMRGMAPRTKPRETVAS